jgi:hypothetical protein
MAQANQAYITSRFHNLSNAALADALGHADAVLKGAEAESKSLKDEFSAAASWLHPARTSPLRPQNKSAAGSIAKR